MQMNELSVCLTRLFVHLHTDDMLFTTPELGPRDLEVLREIDDYRERLRYALRNPKRWTGNLRRHLMARAIRGSNSIEGYDVSLDDALAAVEEDEPMDADRRTWAEITGYRAAMTYVQQLAEARHFDYNVTLMSSLHYMMLSHDLSKLPGQFRRGPVFVHDEETDEIVYEGPDWEVVPGLVDELIAWLHMEHQEPVFVRAAMTHLNLVMIHPFKDGNGRMARRSPDPRASARGRARPGVLQHRGVSRQRQEHAGLLHGAFERRRWPVEP